MAVMVITNGRLIGPRTILEQHCVIIDGGKVKQIAPTSQVLWPEDAQVINVEGGFVAPGFVDLHVHGALGRDAMEGSVETLAQIAKFHVTGGTTAMTPATMTDSLEKITAALDAIEQAMGHNFGGAQIVGAHIEGPYLSAQKCGAQTRGVCPDAGPDRVHTVVGARGRGDADDAGTRVTGRVGTD